MKKAQMLDTTVILILRLTSPLLKYLEVVRCTVSRVVVPSVRGGGAPCHVWWCRAWERAAGAGGEGWPTTTATTTSMDDGGRCRRRSDGCMKRLRAELGRGWRSPSPPPPPPPPPPPRQRGGGGALPHPPPFSETTYENRLEVVPPGVQPIMIIDSAVVSGESEEVVRNVPAFPPDTPPPGESEEAFMCHP